MGGYFTFARLGTVGLVAALVPALPNAVVDAVLDIAQNLGKVKSNTHPGILGVKGHGGDLTLARVASTTCGEAAEAILGTGPLADGELAGEVEVRGASDARAVLGIVESLAAVGAVLD